MDRFSNVSFNERIRYQRSLMIAGIELDYDVNLDKLMGAGGQGDVYAAERKVDKLQVAIKVIPRSKLKPGPGVCTQLTIFKIKN
jgi:serine/threonine protein kinase